MFLLSIIPTPRDKHAASFVDYLSCLLSLGVCHSLFTPVVCPSINVARFLYLVRGFGSIEQEESDFLDPLREQLGYLGSAKEVHRGRGRTLDALQVRAGGNLAVQAET